MPGYQSQHSQLQLQVNYQNYKKAGMHKEPAKRNALPPEQDQSGKEETLVTRRHIVSRDRGVTGIVTLP